jgi:hypothetical protein
MKISTINEFRAAMRHGKFAWPGAYPCFFVTSDGGALSFEAAKSERRSILEAIRDNSNSGWRIIAMEINWEDADLTCDYTNQRIECAYSED